MTEKKKLKRRRRKRESLMKKIEISRRKEFILIRMRF